MTNADLVKTVSDNTGYPQQEVRNIIDSYFNNIIDAVSNNETVKIHNFGSFVPKQFAPRVGRNPKTSEIVPIPSKLHVHFTLSKKFKQAVVVGEN